MKLLHTSDWHVGRTIRGRSRADEHRAVLAEIAGVARHHDVDVVLVVGDLFDSAAPTPEAEQIVFGALLDLASSGAAVIVLSGNHDNARRLHALRPLLELGGVAARPEFRGPDDGGVLEVATRDGRETALVAVVPFLSQRHVVRAADLMAFDADELTGKYASRMARFIDLLAGSFRADTVNVVAAHLTTRGGLLGGGERLAHTVFDYEVPAAAFPSTAHYVALGHLHRRQQVPGPAPIHYCGSPLQLDFGETSDIKAVVVVEAHPGAPAKITDVPLSAGRRLRTLVGTPAELDALAGTTGDDHLRLKVRTTPLVGLADRLRERFPHCVDVIVERPDDDDPAVAERPSRRGMVPGELFAQYLADAEGEADPTLVELFAELLEVAHASDPA
ncbi:exonuclease SbcCD subunit D [soil metagenome]